MKTIFISITSLLFGVALMLLGHGLTGTLLSLRSAAEAYAQWQIGVIMSSYFAGYILGALLCPSLINRIGHIRAFTITASLCSTVVLLQGFIVNPWFWLLGRFIYGACIVNFYLVMESWLNARAEKSQRGTVFSVYMFVNLSALALSQYLLLIGDINSLVLFAVAGMLLSLSLIPIALTRIPEPPKIDQQQPAISLRRTYQLSPLGFVSCFISGLAGGAFWTMGPLFAQTSAASLDATATFMSATIFGGAVMQWPIGRYSDRHDRRHVLMIVTLASALLALALLLTGVLPTGLMPLLMFAYGGACFAIYPLAVAHANDCADARDIVALSGGLLMAYGIGAMFGPVLTGLGMELLGHAFLPAFLSAAWLSLSLYTRRQIQRQSLLTDHETTFAPLTGTSTISLQHPFMEEAELAGEKVEAERE